MYKRPLVLLTIVYAVIVSQNIACCHGASSKGLSAFRDGSKSYSKKIGSEGPKYRPVTDKSAVASTRQLSKFRGVFEDDEGKYSNEKDDQQIMREMRLERARAAAGFGTGSMKDRVGSEKKRFETPSSGSEKKIGQSMSRDSHGFENHGGEYANSERARTGSEKQRVGAEQNRFEEPSSGSYGKNSGLGYMRNGYSQSNSEEEELDRLIGNEGYRISGSRDKNEKEGRNSKFCLEPDYYERIAPGIKQINLGESEYDSKRDNDFKDLDSLRDKKVKYYDSERVKDYTDKKMKALDSFEAGDIGMNGLKESSPIKKPDGISSKNPIANDFDIDHQFDSQSAEEVLQNILDNNKKLGDVKQERSHSNNLETQGRSEKGETSKKEDGNLVGLKNFVDQSSRSNIKSGDRERDAGNFSNQPEAQKSRSQVLEEYSDVLGRIEELYKLLNTPVASGAQKLENPNPYSKLKNQAESENLSSSQSSEHGTERYQNQKFVGQGRNEEKFVNISSADRVSQKPTRDDVRKSNFDSEESRLNHQDYKIQEKYQTDAKFDSSRFGSEKSFDDSNHLGYGSGDDQESKVPMRLKSDRPIGAGRSFDDTDYRSSKNQQTEIPDRYSGSDRSNYNVGESYLGPANPERKPYRNYPESFDGQSSPKREPVERNLKSPECKFENLNPSREEVSEEEERNLQFRSQGNKQVGRKFVGQSRKSGVVKGEELDLGADERKIQNNNKDAKEFQPQKDAQSVSLSKDYDLKQSSLTHEPFASAGQKYASQIGSSRKIGAVGNRKSVIGSKFTEKPYTGEKDKKVGSLTYDYYKKVGNPETFGEKSVVGMRTADKNGYSDPEVYVSRNQGMVGQSKSLNNEDFDDNFRGMMVDQLGERAYQRKTHDMPDSSRNRVSASRHHGFSDSHNRNTYENRDQPDYDDDDVYENSNARGIGMHPDIISKTHPNSHLASGHHQELTDNHSRGQSGMIDESSFGAELDPVAREFAKSMKPEVGAKAGPQSGDQQFKDLKTLQKEENGSSVGGQEENPAGESPGCNSIFRCLAKVGQTLIEPLTGPEVKSDPKAAEEHSAVQQNSARSADVHPVSAGHLHDGHATGRASGVGDTTGTGSKGPLSFLQLDDHPFYGLVTSIIEAAQEATKQRLLEEKHARLQYHPPRENRPQNLQHPALSSTGNTPVVAQAQPSLESSLISSPVIADSQSSQTGNTKAGSVPEKSKNLQESERKMIAKSSQSTGSEKKLSNIKPGSFAKMGVSEPGKSLGNKQQRLGYGKKAAEIINGARKFTTGNSRGVNTGSEKPQSAASLKKASPKSGDAQSKLSAYKKVNFQPVGTKKISASKPETGGAGKILSKPNNQKVESKNSSTRPSQKGSTYAPTMRATPTTASLTSKTDIKNAPSKQADAISTASSKLTS